MKDKVLHIWDRIPPFFKNKFVLTASAFLVYMLFFDSLDIPTQIQHQRHLHRLNRQTQYLEKMIEKDRLEYASTLSTIEQMEKFAREQYLMKRDDEDLYVIEVE